MKQKEKRCIKDEKRREYREWKIGDTVVLVTLERFKKCEKILPFYHKTLSRLFRDLFLSPKDPRSRMNGHYRSPRMPFSAEESQVTEVCISLRVVPVKVSRKNRIECHRFGLQYLNTPPEPSQ